MTVAGFAFAAALSLSFTSLVLAQSGTLDQISPVGPAGQTASIALDPPSLVWQAQVRWSTSGFLEGVRLTLGGPVGAQAIVRIRSGAGCYPGALPCG